MALASPHPLIVDPGDLDLARTFTLQRLGRYDPTATAGPGHFAKTFRTPAGEVAHTTLSHRDGELRIEASGPGAEAVLRFWRERFPIDDDYDAFKPEAPRMRRLSHRFPGLRFLRVPWLFDVAVSVVLQQRVRYVDAVRAWAQIAKRLGERTTDGFVLPSAKTLARTPTYEFQSMGIDPKRARALVALAREETFKPFLVPETSFEDLRRRLMAIRGIGPWTTEMILGFGAGDPDAVPTKDLHLPRTVVRAFGKSGPLTDEHMLELLEPYRGHRFRVIRLLWAHEFSGLSPRTWR
ncbi:MAG: hypothetical protein QNJ98_19560 [Planctomycetota bacterium]|nr:hypothetical protein [Planctomycetota bacterium]